MKSIPKGAFGYTNAHKKRQLLKTILFFLLPIGIFVVGFLTTKTKENYFTIIAVVGSLPACKELVNVCMFVKRRSMSKELYEEIKSHAGDMVTAYELVLTTYEKSYPVTALVIAGSEVAGYTEAKEALDWKKAEEHMRTVLKNNGISQTHIHIFREKKQFLERVDALARQGKEELPFEPDERYPGYSREQVMREVLLALSI